MTRRISPRTFSSRHGIAIGPILFVIAVLAILAVAISATSGTFSTNNEREKAHAYASAIIDYSTLIYNALQRVKALGCDDTQISFENGVVTGYTNASTPADGHCKIFAPSGGGMSWALPPVDSQTTASDYRYVTNYMVGYGTTADELTIIAPNLTTTVCDEINSMTNKQSQWESGGGNNGANYNFVKFVGAYGDTASSMNQITGTCASCKPPVMGCFCDGTGACTASHQHYFFRMLLSR